MGMHTVPGPAFYDLRNPQAPVLPQERLDPDVQLFHGGGVHPDGIPVPLDQPDVGQADVDGQIHLMARQLVDDVVEPALVVRAGEELVREAAEWRAVKVCAHDGEVLGEGDRSVSDALDAGGDIWGRQGRLQLNEVHDGLGRLHHRHVLADDAGEVGLALLCLADQVEQADGLLEKAGGCAGGSKYFGLVCVIIIPVQDRLHLPLLYSNRIRSRIRSLP